MYSNRHPATPKQMERESGVPLPITFHQALDFDHHELSTRTASAVEHILDPSPASTYGNTPFGDSVPTTPLDLLKASDTAIIGADRKSILATHGEPYYAYDAQDDGVHYKPSTIASDQRGDAGDLSPTQLVGLQKVARRSMESLPTTPSVTRRREDIRREEILNTPSWRHGQAIPAIPDLNDPFKVKSEDLDFKRPGLPASAYGKTQTNGSEAVDEFDVAKMTLTSEEYGIPGLRVVGNTYYVDDTEITRENAQALLPQKANVFIGNLNHSASDLELVAAIETTFDQFGKCWAKVSRDPKGMPYAFAQYFDENAAKQALKDGNKLCIVGRDCRVEKAKPTRALYLMRLDGDDVSEVEAIQVLERYGELERTWVSSDTEIEMLRLAVGRWVKFAHFGDNTKALLGMRNNIEYRLEQLSQDGPGSQAAYSVSEAAKRRVRANLGGIPTSPSQGRRSAARPNNSIFVRGLTADATIRQLTQTFGYLSRFVSVELIAKADHTLPDGIAVFAYLEFFRWEDALRAKNGVHIINGHRLELEWKESSDLVHKYHGQGRPQQPIPVSMTSNIANGKPAMGDSNNQQLSGQFGGELQYPSGASVVPATPMYGGAFQYAAGPVVGNVMATPIHPSQITLSQQYANGSPYTPYGFTTGFHPVYTPNSLEGTRYSSSVNGR
ncbi:hypothetical protein MMC25_006065 [Agyrium rufum]|nr:hypothetical protein [Agyrium rufum]